MAQGSRLLNENGPFLGLNTHDLMGAMGVLVAASSVLSPVGLDLLALPIAIVSLVALVPVRLRFRRRIIRDAIAFYLTPRRFHVPTQHS